MDASLTASILDFLAARLGLGDSDACDPLPSDGEPLRGADRPFLVRWLLSPWSEISGVGGELN